MAKRKNKGQNTNRTRKTEDANMEIGKEPTNKTQEEKQKEFDAKLSTGRK